MITLLSAIKKGPPITQGGPLNVPTNLRHQSIRAAKSMGKTLRGWPRMRMTMLIMKNTSDEINISATSILV
jgi:hypothetical protein